MRCGVHHAVQGDKAAAHQNDGDELAGAVLHLPAPGLRGEVAEVKDQQRQPADAAERQHQVRAGAGDVVGRTGQHLDKIHVPSLTQSAGGGDHRPVQRVDFQHRDVIQRVSRAQRPGTVPVFHPGQVRIEALDMRLAPERGRRGAVCGDR
ncbi:hypothetical protein D3C80_1551980 [compost metagenome]